jgi:phosphatidylserine/phosphatidylglycerophosphate/cardiolipin synthase-like enzyme
MHIKAFPIDGRLLRTGSANFSGSGEKMQDNDLILIESSAAVSSVRRQIRIHVERSANRHMEALRAAWA